MTNSKPTTHNPKPTTQNQQPLWAPWRLEYIDSALKEDGGGCFLCAALKSKDDRASLLLHRDRLGFVVMNLYPYNNGHLLVAPNRHTGGLDELEMDEVTALGLLTRKCVGWLDAAYHPDGYNIGLNLGRVAGAGLPGHLHYHIVPRWNGDTNFMPVLGMAKVVSEGLGASFDRLREVVVRMEGGG